MGIGHGQGDPLARIRERPGIVPNRVVGVQIRIIRHQVRGVLCENKVTVGGEDGIRWKSEIDPVGETPIGQINRVGPRIIKLHELIVVIAGDGFVHNFIDDNALAPNFPIRRARGFGGQPLEGRPAVWNPPHGNAVLLRLKQERIDHVVQIGVYEIDRFPARAQRKTKGGFCEIHEAGRPNRGPVRNTKLVGPGRVAQPATGQIHRRRAVVVKLHVIQIREIGVREEFVDEDVANRLEAQSIHHPGRAADQIAFRPGLRMILPVGGPRQDQRMAGTVGGQRPWPFGLIIHFQNNCILPIAQPDGA